MPLLLGASLLVPALVVSSDAHAAASLIVRPTRITITEDQPVVAVDIQNTGATETVLQLQIMAWSQQEGDDVYTEAEELGLIVCPPMFTIPAGETQIVRIALDDIERDWNREGTFRLFIQEIPPEPSEDTTAVQVAVRIGVPIFLSPAKVTQPPLAWSVEDRGGEGLWATARNDGNVHALVSGVRLQTGDQVHFQTSTHRYVLPGATVTWRLDTSAPFEGSLPSSPLQLIVATDQGPYEEMISVDR